MAIEMLAKEAEGLSEEGLKEVMEFIQYLKYKMNISYNNTKSDGIIRKPGGLEGPLIMADDFDDTPDCFKEYL